MKVIEQRIVYDIEINTYQHTDKKTISIHQDDDYLVIEKGQPLQELIDYLTEVNKDFKPKKS